MKMEGLNQSQTTQTPKSELLGNASAALQNLRCKLPSDSLNPADQLSVCGSRDVIDLNTVNWNCQCTFKKNLRGNSYFITKLGSYCQ